MSGFDDNPFDDNPFKDPAIQQVTRNTANNSAANLEDYNPFDGTSGQGQQTSKGNAQSPAVMSPVQETTPAPFVKVEGKSQPQGAQQNIPISTEELQRRQEELERKARELERREEELRNNPYNVRRNNWPPLPESLPIQPCFYQDINVDIPVEFQRVVRHLYYLWVLHSIVLIANSLIWLLRVLVIPDQEFFGTFVKLILSLVYILVFVPSSYVCWFRPAYKAFRSDSSFNFMVFFFVFTFQLMVSLLLAIYMSGSNGIYDGVTVVNTGGVAHIMVGIFVILMGLSFLVCAILDLFLLIRIHGIYKSTGASFAKAQQEFASGVIRNEHVQGAATNIAAEAVRQQFRNAASPGNGSNNNPPRY